ncbi:MAG TPA: DASS family sodium-coupled anion symporter [Alphaproteobacteria bacterium]
MSETGSDQDGAAEEPGPGRARTVGLVAGPAAAAAMLLAGPPAGLGAPAWQCAAVAVLMALWWMTEALPIPATALIPLAAFPLLGVASTAAAAAPYAHPLVFLFMGGFLIALAMQRWELHRRIALNLVALFGTRPARLIAGFMVATAALSMWVSNTATTLMMLPIAISVIALLRRDAGAVLDRNFPAALLLGIAYAASIGGIGTLIGTPPNAFLAGFMQESYGVTIGFAEWLLVGLPLVAVMLPLAWLTLVRVACPIRLKEAGAAAAVIRGELAALGPMGRGERTVLVVFAATAAAWIFRPLISETMPGLGLDDTVIAIAGALVLFVIPVNWKERTFALDWRWAIKLPWGVLLLFGGGLTLADAIRTTGLADWIGGGTGALGGLPVVVIVIAVTALIILLTELTSNTATTATFLPIVASVAVGLGENPLLLAVPAALAASCAFMMPVATPPNAIVFASGHLRIGQMIRAGIWLNLIGVAAITALGYTVVLAVLGVEPGTLPAWAAP